MVKMVSWGSVRMCVPLLASIILVHFTALADYKGDRSKSGGGFVIEDFSKMSSELEMKVKDRESGESGEDKGVKGILKGLKGISSEELKMLEGKFLKLLGMKERPKFFSKERIVPKELLELYERQISLGFITTDLFLPGKLTQSANTARTFGPTEITSIELNKVPTTLKFNLSSLPPHEKVSGAELRVPFSVSIPEKSANPPTRQVFARILIYDIVKPSKRSKHDKKHIQAISYATDTKLVNLTNRKYPTFWLTFDILPAVLRWVGSKNQTKSNHGLSLEIIGLNGESFEDVEGLEKFNLKVKTSSPVRTPVNLFVYSDDGHNSKGRGKRNAKQITRRYRSAYHHYTQGRRRKPHRHKNRKRNLCSRKPMFVDFTDVGWNDWIVAPPGYQAFYCSGECPFPMSEHLNATNHAVIQALINSMNPALVPPPCCVPSKYSSLSLLYTDSSDRIVLKNYNDMVVDSCGCS